MESSLFIWAGAERQQCFLFCYDELKDVFIDTVKSRQMKQTLLVKEGR